MSDLSKDSYDLEAKLDELEQYTRRDCLEITGIPIVPNDNPALSTSSRNVGGHLCSSSPAIDKESEGSTHSKVHSKREEG